LRGELWNRPFKYHIPFLFEQEEDNASSKETLGESCFYSVEKLYYCDVCGKEFSEAGNEDTYW
jgi:hypothetical protein